MLGSSDDNDFVMKQVTALGRGLVRMLLNKGAMSQQDLKQTFADGALMNFDAVASIPDGFLCDMLVEKLDDMGLLGMSLVAHRLGRTRLSKMLLSHVDDEKLHNEDQELFENILAEIMAVN